MSDANVLAEIKRLTALGQVVFTFHATLRMRERGVKARDVVRALLTATAAIWQAERANYKMEGGTDCDGDDLTVIVSLEADVIVVTIF